MCVVWSLYYSMLYRTISLKHILKGPGNSWVDQIVELSHLYRKPGIITCTFFPSTGTWCRWITGVYQPASLVLQLQTLGPCEWPCFRKQDGRHLETNIKSWPCFPHAVTCTCIFMCVYMCTCVHASCTHTHKHNYLNMKYIQRYRCPYC